MPFENRALLSKRARLMVLLAVTATAIALMLGAQAPAAQAGFDVWKGTFYTGAWGTAYCPSTGELGYLTYEWKSAKNNCGAQHVRIGWNEGGSINWKACMNPGGERPDPGRFNEYQGVANC